MNILAWRSELRYCSHHHPLTRSGLRGLLGSGAVLLATLAVWWPVLHTHDSLQARIAAQRRALVETQQAGELLRLYDAARRTAPQLERKLEQSVSQAQLVESLARLARQHQVRVVSETYQEGRSPAGQALLLAELTVQGSYGAVRHFLRGLPGLPMWNEIQEVRLEGVRSAAAVRGQIRIATYRLAPAANARPR